MASLTCAFRYGREDLDVLGLTFRKELHAVVQQVFPPTQENQEKLCTRLQERLLRKLGKNAYPFFFEIPKHSPCSVTLQVKNQSNFQSYLIKIIFNRFKNFNLFMSCPQVLESPLSQHLVTLDVLAVSITNSKLTF